MTEEDTIVVETFPGELDNTEEENDALKLSRISKDDCLIVGDTIDVDAEDFKTLDATVGCTEPAESESLILEEDLI